ncbi:hypothetical protein HZH68_000819 [Vespula germanica]|uniref:Uncharacterized protein n=1 Tax=Vespula germanica TaxID=30212 RepID=A0A834NUB1_VESGE|nr:hypothetical protein HZH68_000819 [Vespula germanica]
MDKAEVSIQSCRGEAAAVAHQQMHHELNGVEARSSLPSTLTHSSNPRRPNGSRPIGDDLRAGHGCWDRNRIKFEPWETDEDNRKEREKERKRIRDENKSSSSSSVSSSSSSVSSSSSDTSSNNSSDSRLVIVAIVVVVVVVVVVVIVAVIAVLVVVVVISWSSSSSSNSNSNSSNSSRVGVAVVVVLVIVIVAIVVENSYPWLGFMCRPKENGKHFPGLSLPRDFSRHSDSSKDGGLREGR